MGNRKSVVILMRSAGSELLAGSIAEGPRVYAVWVLGLGGAWSWELGAGCREIGDYARRGLGTGYICNHCIMRRCLDEESRDIAVRWCVYPYPQPYMYLYLCLCGGIGGCCPVSQIPILFLLLAPPQRHSSIASEMEARADCFYIFVSLRFFLASRMLVLLLLLLSFLCC